jgi:hypothetical protein
MEENKIPKTVLYMNWETRRMRGRPRNRWQDEVREDGRIVGREEWQEKVYNREEWKKLLGMARNRHILHMPIEWMNEFFYTTLCGFILFLMYRTHSPSMCVHKLTLCIALLLLLQSEPSYGHFHVLLAVDCNSRLEEVA